MQDIKEKLIDLVNSPSYQYILSNSYVIPKYSIYLRDGHHVGGKYTPHEILPHEMIRWDADKIIKNLLDREEIGDIHGTWLFDDLSDIIHEDFVSEALQIEDHETKIHSLRAFIDGTEGAYAHWVENIYDDELFLKAIKNLELLRPHTTQIRDEFQELIKSAHEISEEIQVSTQREIEEQRKIEEIQVKIDRLLSICTEEGFDYKVKHKKDGTITIKVKTKNCSFAKND